MARFRGLIRGQNGGLASRLGGPNTGIEVEANGWGSGVRVIGRVERDEDRDVFEIYATAGSSPASFSLYLGVVRKEGDVITFQPALPVPPTRRGRK